MIRVLCIQETISSGGVERRRLSLAKFLDKHIFQLMVICTFENGNIANEIRENGVEVIAIGAFKNLFDWKQHKKVQKIIQEFKPHIIHGAVFEGVTMAAVNGFLKRVPIVIIEETSDPQNRSWRGNLLMKLFAKMSLKVIGVSPSTVDYLKNKVHIRASKIQLINNGVAIPRPVSNDERMLVKKKFNISESDIVIGSVGRMLDDSHKRFSDLIKAFSNVRQSQNDLKLLLVGDGKERSAYEQLVRHLGIQDQVIFVGYQEDIAKFYACMDIFCLVSSREAFGLVLAEAMLHRLPIVATRVGGMQHIVDDQKTGFLVDRYNINDISNNLSKLCKDRELRHILALNGYEKAINEYTEEQYVSKIKTLYEKLAESILSR